MHRLLKIRAVNDAIHQPKGFLAGDMAAEILLQDFMIDAGKIAEYVATQNMRIAITIMLIGRYGLVRALAFSVGEGMADKTTLEKRPNHIDERMMHDAISKRGGGNDTVFGTF